MAEKGVYPSYPQSAPTWWFVVDPVAVNVAVLLGVALLFNGLFPWRRYPAAWALRGDTAAAGSAISHESFVYALSEMDTFVDVSEHDLLRIYDIALGREQRGGIQPDVLEAGACYSNGRYGEDWWVREIISIDRPEGRVRFRVVAGRGRRGDGEQDLGEFASAVKYRVYRDEDNWRRAEGG